jgi:hypothetical protein
MAALMSTRATTLDHLAEAVVDYGVPAIIVTLPLEFTTKYLHTQLVRFVIAAVVLAFAYLVVRGRRSLAVPRFASVWVLVALCAASVASWVLTRAPGSTNTLVDIVAYPIVGLLIANLVVTREQHRRAWLAFIASALGVAILGLFLYVLHVQIWAPNPAVANRDNITFADPNITARFLTLGACAAVLLFAAAQAPAWLTGAAAVGCGIVLPMTYSRSGLALFVLMVALMVPLAFNRRRAAAMAAVALIAFGLSTGLNPDTRQRAAGAADTVVGFVTGTHKSEASAPPIESGVALEDNRVFLVAAGLKMFTDHPVSGVGFGGYQHALLTTYRSFLPEGYTDSVSHTAVVTVLAEQGVVGLLLLTLFLLLLAREAWVARRRRDGWAVWATLSAAMVVPILLYSQFEGRLLQEPYLWLTLGLFYGAQRVALGSEVAVRPPHIARPRRSVEAA